MKLDFEYIEQALLDYNAKSEYKQASIIMLRNIFEEAETKQCDIHIVSTRTFEKEIELYVDTETDEWVLKHKGVIKKRAKSKFECLLTKQELKKRLGV